MKRTWENYTRYMHSFKNLDYLSPLRKQPVLSVHIVCLGNICRSPIANAVLLGATKDLSAPKVKVDSSGTGAWHVGQDAAEYSKQVWQDAGYEYEHLAKQFKSDFFQKHDLILAMDLSNRNNLLKFVTQSFDHPDQCSHHACIILTPSAHARLQREEHRASKAHQVHFCFLVFAVTTPRSAKQ